MFSQAVSSDIWTSALCPVSLQPTSLLLVVESQRAQARAVPAFAMLQSVIDVAYEPMMRDPTMGMLDRMISLGPGMFEYFASPPSRAAVHECVRKRMNFEHELVLQAQRRGEPPPPHQWLWILSAGRPQEALDDIFA